MPRRIPYWIIYLILITALFGASTFIPSAEVIPLKHKVTDPSKATLDALIEAVKLIGSLDTALFGAAGTIAVKGKEWSAHWGRFEAISLMVVFALGGFSFYAMYLALISILGMLDNGTIYLFETRLEWAISLQYSSFIGGVIVLGFVFMRMLEARR